jgi:hypothetical protein
MRSLDRSPSMPLDDACEPVCRNGMLRAMRIPVPGRSRNARRVVVAIAAVRVGSDGVAMRRAWIG